MDMTAASDNPHTALLSHAFNQAKQVMLIVSAHDMVIVHANNAMCHLLGYNKQALIGKNLTDIECALQDLFFWDDLKLNPINDSFRLVESEWLTQKGEILPIEKYVTSCTEGGKAFFIINVEDISSRKQAIEDQIRLTSQLQSSLEATAEGIVSIDLEGNVHSLNKRFILMWDFDDTEALPRNLEQVAQHIKEALADEQIFDDILTRIKGDAEIEEEETLSLSDGRYFILASKPEYLRDNIMGRVFSVRDVTKLKRTELEAKAASEEKSKALDILSVSESRLNRIINSSLIGIFQSDLDGNIFEANDVLLKLSGIDPLPLKDNKLSLSELIHPSPPHSYQEILEEVNKREQPPPFDGELLCKNGAQRSVVVGLSRLEGSSDEMIGFIMDVTHQQEAERMKNEFVSVVSHELRTPITSILGSLGLIKSGQLGELPDAIKDLITIAHRNSERLITLVNDILDIEKLASGKMELVIVPLDLVEMANQAIESNATYASNRNVSYKLETELSEAAISADQERLMQIFSNLMSNAAKYSPEGDDVTLRVLAIDGAYRVEVTDKGPGIPENFRDKIFGKFAQADGTDTRRPGGTGLGLNITKNLVEMMAGEIGFDSVEGEGSTFWFTMKAKSK